jgi:L-aminopeptidase/D-esterase-like protein
MRPQLRPGPHNDLTDVAGVRVGHHHRIGRGWLTGTTVVLPPPGTIASGEVRGGAPGTRETDLLEPHRLVQSVHGLCLTGGSAYGLAAADGVVEWLAAHGRGVSVGSQPHMVVPVVPGAVLFDLGRGAFAHRPDRTFGVRAAGAAAGRGGAGPVAQGSVGAGAGARSGGVKGGVGSASAVLPGGQTVAVLVALNSAGRTWLAGTGELLGARHLLPGELRLRRPGRADAERLEATADAAMQTPPRNTTLAVVATDADLSKVECRKLAEIVHDGLARAIDPLHLMADGDVVFSLATAARPLGEGASTAHRYTDGRAVQLDEVLRAAAPTAARAVVHAVVRASSVGGMVAYRDLCPSAFRP